MNIWAILKSLVNNYQGKKIFIQGRQNGFQSGRGGGRWGMEHWKVLSATMVGWQEKFSNSTRSRMAKTIIFWPWWQSFNSFCFETPSLLPLSPFFLFAMQKSGEPWTPAPQPPRCRRPCYSLLEGEKISDKEYEHVLKTWNKFEMKTMKDRVSQFVFKMWRFIVNRWFWKI